jgi:hypothetical protein
MAIVTTNANLDNKLTNDCIVVTLFALLLLFSNTKFSDRTCAFYGYPGRPSRDFRGFPSDDLEGLPSFDFDGFPSFDFVGLPFPNFG